MKSLKNLRTILLILFISVTIISGLLTWYFYSIPDIRELEHYQPVQATRIFDINEKIISEFFKEKRVIVALRNIPQNLQNAIIATEDHEFYKHWGINLTSILRAFLKNILAGEIVQGGSTLTQQLAKNLFLTSERTVSRKIKELILTIRIETHYSKREILEFYCNQIFFGQGAYGAEAASQTYFGKPVAKLNLAEAAYLAGFIQAPSAYSPYKNPKRAKDRQLFVLKRMLKLNFISEDKFKKMSEMPVNFISAKYRKDSAPYFTEYIRKILEEKYGEKALYENGLSVYTTLDLKLQNIAQRDFKKQLEEKNNLLGKYNPIYLPKGKSLEGKLEEEKRIDGKKELLNYIEKNKITWGLVKEASKEKAIVSLGWGVEGTLTKEGVKWIKKEEFKKHEEDNRKTGVYRVKIENVNEALAKNHLIKVKVTSIDSKKKNIQMELVQEQTLQGGLIAIEPGTGFIKAMIGGYDYAEFSFNRAIQAKRQPGSAFKPFIYTAAIDKGFTGATVIIDSPVTFKKSNLPISSEFNVKDSTDTNQIIYEGPEWTPQNYYGIFYGPTTLRKALAFSLNIATIKLLQETGLNLPIEFAHRMGIKSKLTPNLTLALGTSEVTLLELTSAYSTFANQGIHIEPVAILMVKDTNGNILEKYTHSEQICLKEDVNYIMVDLLQAVVKDGTAKSAKKLQRPIGAKTGTTDRSTDAWFIGFTPDIVLGIRVGFDDRDSMGQHASGEEMAGPIWYQIMAESLPGTEPRDFPIPKNIVFKDIDAQTGLLATAKCKEVVTQAFIKGTEPVKECDADEKNWSIENLHLKLLPEKNSQ